MPDGHIRSCSNLNDTSTAKPTQHDVREARSGGHEQGIQALRARINGRTLCLAQHAARRRTRHSFTERLPETSRLWDAYDVAFSPRRGPVYLARK